MLPRGGVITSLCSIAPEGNDDQSAVCCLIMVLCAIVDAAPEQDKEEILALTGELSLMDFLVLQHEKLQGPDTAKLLAGITEQLLSKGFHGADRRPEDEFIQLCEGNAMIDSLWSLEATKLWREMLISSIPAEGQKPEWQPIGILPRLNQISAMIDYTRFHADLKNAVTTCFSVVMQRGNIYRPICNHPAVARVHLRPHGPADFRALQRFALGRDSLYRLVAVVRMRANEGEPNLVRCYNIRGQRWAMRYPDGRMPSYTAPEWNVGALGHEYILFYVRCDRHDYVRDDPGDDDWEKRYIPSEPQDEVLRMGQKMNASVLPRPDLADQPRGDGSGPSVYGLSRSMQHSEEHTAQSKFHTSAVQQHEALQPKEPVTPLQSAGKSEQRRPTQSDASRLYPPIRQRSDSPNHCDDSSTSSSSSSSSSEEDGHDAKRRKLEAKAAEQRANLDLVDSFL
ncbi:hypothetical protein ACHAQH_007985 [Verticillium albo-atrum]